MAMDSSQSKDSKNASRSKESPNSASSHERHDESAGHTAMKTSHKPNSTKAKGGRARRRDRNGKKNDDSGFKLVLRMLPPDLTEDQFLKTLRPEFGDLKKNGVVGWYYVQGHYSVKFRSEPVYSRCYLSFNTMELLDKFSKTVKPIKFVDDKENAANAVIKVSAYNRRLVATSSKTSHSRQSLEGSIDGDILFQTFMKSSHILEERKSDFSYADVSTFRSLEKELAKRKAVESEIQKKTAMAIVALTGDGEKEGKGKGKKKNEKKDKAAKEGVDTSPTDAVNSTTRKRKKAKKKGNAKADKKTKDIEKNNNVVILEAAGRKELQRRKKLQMEKEQLSKNIDTTKSKRKPRSKGESKDVNALSKDDAQNSSRVKLLRREIAEHS